MGGTAGPRDLRAISRAVDIYLLSSQWDNCPYACLEAMAAGRAVVCSDQGGMPELIQNGVNGLLAQADSPQACVEQLTTMIDDPDLRRRVGEGARRSVELKFSDTHIAQATQGGVRRLHQKLYAERLSQNGVVAHCGKLAGR